MKDKIPQIIQEDKSGGKDTDLDVGIPEDVSKALRTAAEKYNDSSGELSAAWQDKDAGKIWSFIAREFEKLADKIDQKVK